MVKQDTSVYDFFLFDTSSVQLFDLGHHFKTFVTGQEWWNYVFNFDLDKPSFKASLYQAKEYTKVVWYV